MEKQSLQQSLDDLARAADGRHNLAAYLVTLLLYRNNGGAGNNDTMTQYMRRVKAKEESRAAAATGDGGGPTSRWLSNKGCVLCHRPTIKVIYNKTWRRLSSPPLA